MNLSYHILINKQFQNVFFSSDVNKLRSILNEMVEAIIKEFLKPHEYSLIFRATS